MWYFVPFAVSLWHKDVWLPCTERISYRRPNAKKPGYILRWKILDHFLSVSLENVVRVAGFLLLQDPHQPVLSFGHFPSHCFPLLARLLSRQTGLTSLSLRNVWLEGKHLEQVRGKLG